MDRTDGPFVGSGTGLDTWRVRPGQDVRTCSYCGSVNPDDFMAAVRAGAVVGPTDKNYKVYLHEALSAEELASRDPALHSMTGKHLGKFYTVHLSPGHSAEFVGLWREGRVAWGAPGYPYSRLYLPGLAAEPTE
jgi:hypothetical protein